MNTQTQIENRSVTSDRASGSESVVGFAILGCLIAGAVGIVKAMSMDRGVDVFFCVLGSLVAFGVVFFVYFRKS